MTVQKGFLYSSFLNSSGRSSRREHSLTLCSLFILYFRHHLHTVQVLIFCIKAIPRRSASSLTGIHLGHAYNCGSLLQSGTNLFISIKPEWCEKNWLYQNFAMLMCSSVLGIWFTAISFYHSIEWLDTHIIQDLQEHRIGKSQQGKRYLVSATVDQSISNGQERTN